MSIISNLFSKPEKYNWDDIKNSEQVYPKHSISILKITTETGKFGTGWVDKGYLNYNYKKNCPYNFLIMVDLTDEIAEKNPDLDMGTIEEFFVTELRETGIAHIVARLVTDNGLNIEMYVENEDAAMKRLQAVLDNPNRIISFNCEVNIDPKWKAVSGLLK